MKNLYKKYTAVIIIIAVLFGMLLPVANVSADEGDDGDDAQSEQPEQPEEKTRIISVIPYVRIDQQNLPVDSKEDLALYGDTSSLKIQFYISPDDVQMYSAPKYGTRVYIFKLKPHEETSDINNENFSASLYEDIVPNSPTGGFSYGSMLKVNLGDFQNGEIFNKFVIAVKDTSTNKYTAISDAKYIDNINCLSNKKEIPPVSRTKKGLSIQMPGEARILGVDYTTINIFLNDFMAAENGPNTVMYKYENKEYYFNIDKISEYDKKIKYFTNEGINVTAVLLIYARGYTPGGTPRASGGNRPSSPITATTPKATTSAAWTGRSSPAPTGITSGFSTRSAACARW